MLGTAQAALLGSSAQSQPVPQAYTGFVDALNPIRHWPLGELADRTGLFPIAAFGSHETGLPAIAQLDASGNARGFNGFDAYGTIEHDVAYEVAAGGVFVLMQPDQVGTKMQIFNSGTGSVAGSMALEVEDNGQPRAYRRRSDGVLVTIVGSVGQIAAGTPYLYGVTWGPNGLRLWLMDENLQPGLVASEPETDWATIADTATKYLGRWSASPIGHFNGVLGHLQFYGYELTPTQIESLALPQLVVWLNDIDAGFVAASDSATIDLAPYAHPATGFTPAVASQGSLGTASVNGEDIDYAAGVATGNDDTFTAKITAGGIDSRTATVTIDVVDAATGLTRPTVALAVGEDGVPGSNVVYVAPGGSGNGTIGSPYGTLEAAHNHPSLGAGWTIVCRGGTYSRSTAFTPTKSGTSGNPITVMAYPGETVVLDYGSEFAAYRTPGGGLWEIENAGLKLWRSVSTSFGAAARVFGQWEEAGEPWQLYGYKTTGPSETGTGADYYGPGVRIGSDGRLHIRFQRPHPAQVTSKWPSYQPGTSGGNWVIPATEDPNDYPIYLARQSGAYALTFSGVSHWTIHDINIMGRERAVLVTGTCTGITIERGLWRGCYVGVLKSNAVTTNLVVRRIQAVSGRLDYFSWGFIKSRHGATEMDDQAFFICSSGGGGGTNITVEDCYAANYFDVFRGGDTDANMAIHYNWFDNCHDDLFQLPTDTNGVEIAYNVCIDTPLNDWELTNGSSTGNFYLHHNICWQRLPRLWDTNQGLACHATGVDHFHSGATGRFQPRQIYNNTFITNGGSNTFGGNPIGHCDTQSSNELALANSTFNNLLMVYADRNDWVTGESSAHNNDSCAWGAYLQGVSNEELDHNHYARILAYPTPRSAMIGPFYDLEDNGAVRQGGPYTFASAAALAGHPANLIGAENNGSSEDITNTGVNGMNAAAPLVDLEALDFRPKPGSALASGAKDLSSTGWPGASNAIWRGALDPNETGSAQVGPRQPA